MSHDLEHFLRDCQQRVDAALHQHLPSSANQPACRLMEAMRYSSVNGGKRVRPVLVYAAAQAIADQANEHDPAIIDCIAAAVECIHAYSLVHDDLPAMDDDDLRRGQPTCHKAFDEATAILAGDALQTQAFELLLNTKGLQAATLLQLSRTLAHASGARGMVAGQAIDLGAVNSRLDLEQLQLMHSHKTGALIKASVLMGAQATEAASDAQLSALSTYADAIGLAFQVQDDILDVTSATEVLGKRQGADEALNKPTYVTLLGLDGAKQKAQQLCRDALQALDEFGPAADHLRQLATYIVERSH